MTTVSRLSVVGRAPLVPRGPVPPLRSEPPNVPEPAVVPASVVDVQPQALAVTDNPRVYHQASDAFLIARDDLDALATLQHQRAAGNNLAMVCVDVQLRCHGGYATVRRLRDAGIRLPIYLVADHPMPSDLAHATRNGAQGLLPRSAQRVASVLQNHAAPHAETQAPPWLGLAVVCLREFLGSEAQRVTAELYAVLSAREKERPVTCLRVLAEASLLLPDDADRRALAVLAQRQLSRAAAR